MKNFSVVLHAYEHSQTSGLHFNMRYISTYVTFKHSYISTSVVSTTNVKYRIMNNNCLTWLKFESYHVVGWHLDTMTFGYHDVWILLHLDTNQKYPNVKKNLSKCQSIQMSETAYLNVKSIQTHINVSKCQKKIASKCKKI